MSLSPIAEGTDILDMLFNQGDGILASDNYLIDGFADHQVNSDMKSLDFVLSDFEADELLSCLTESNFLSSVMHENVAENSRSPKLSVDAYSETSDSGTYFGRCHEDHMYSKSPDENGLSSPAEPFRSPSAGSVTSAYSYGADSSACDVVLTEDCYSSSPVSFESESQCSPLATNVEDFTIGTVGSSSMIILQNDQLFEAMSAAGINTGLDNSGLVSLDMAEVDVESDSDEGSWGAGSESVNEYSMYDDVMFDSSATGSGLPFTVRDIDPKSRKRGHAQSQELLLSDEEKILLAREGITIPTDVPLTKEEERALKSVRRKIRNKVSAKVSRKRKQEYVEGLEKRVKICSMQNRQLQMKIDKLEKLNQSFLVQLKKLQAMVVVPSGINARHAQTGTCIMVLVLSFAFFILPSLGPWLGNSGQMSLSSPDKSVGTGRKILQTAREDDTMLFSLPPDQADSKSYYDQYHHQFTPAVANPFVPHDKQAVDSADRTLAADQNSKENSSTTNSDFVDDLTEMNEVLESMVDLSKYPAKNDL